MDTPTLVPPPAPELDSERVFLACVLHTPAVPARRLLAGMRADDFADPAAALVAQLTIELVAAGHDPVPAAVLSHAEHTGRVPAPSRHAVDDKQGERYSRFALWLLDTYGLTTWPGLGVHLKAAVIEGAWRRAVRSHATRLLQACDESPADVLAELVSDTTALDELRMRLARAEREARPDDGPAPGRLGVAA